MQAARTNSGHQYFLVGTAYEHGTEKKEIPPPWSNEGYPGSHNKVITIPYWSAACCVLPTNEVINAIIAIGYYSTSNNEKADVIWTKLIWNSTLKSIPIIVMCNYFKEIDLQNNLLQR